MYCIEAQNVKTSRDFMTVLSRWIHNCIYQYLMLLNCKLKMVKIVNCILYIFSQFSSVTQSCLALCNPMDYSIPGLPVHQQLAELAQTHVR